MGNVNEKSKYFLLYHVSVPHYYELFCKDFGLFLTFSTAYTISDKGSDVVIFQRGDSFHPVGGSKPAASLLKKKFISGYAEPPIG